MLNYILKQLTQPSTWRGLVLILTAVGVHLTPEQANSVVTIGLGIAGAIGTFFPDKIGTPTGGTK